MIRLIIIASLALSALPLRAEDSRFINIATRGYVGTGAAALTAGFVIGPGTTKTVLIRAVGPTLANFGLTVVLADPFLTLFNSSGATLATNETWLAAHASAMAAAGAFALNSGSKDAALITTLSPGAYTAQVTGVGDTTGLAIVEVYDLTGLTYTTTSTTTALATAGNGDAITDPSATATTYAVTLSGQTVYVPTGMVYVRAGAFTMGAGSTAHTVTLGAYSIGKFAVTNAEYKIFIDTTARAVPQASQESKYGAYWDNRNYPVGKGAAPVTWVTYADALAYCAWLSQKTGWTVTLPTEAQWEHAARGPNNYAYPWGNAAGDTTSCNYRQVCMNELGLTTWFEGSDAYYTITNDQGGYTKSVATYATDLSGYGAYDLAGNAATWCLDWYAAGYYDTVATSVANPTGPTTGTTRVTRGGSWYHTMGDCAATARGSRSPTLSAPTIGFRVVVNLPI